MNAPLLELAQRWRGEAGLLRRYGLESGAVMLEAHAADLETALRDQANEELTLSQAAAESGKSERRLRELLADGRLPNAGRKYAPRIRRADLPAASPRRSAPAYSPEEDAHRLLAG
jgi:hypothetical protein